MLVNGAAVSEVAKIRNNKKNDGGGLTTLANEVESKESTLTNRKPISAT